MQDDESTHSANGAAPFVPAPGGAEAGAAGWRRIAQIPVHSAGPGRALGDALGACLPAPLISAGLRAAVEQAVLSALARRERQTGCLPRFVVVSLYIGCLASPATRAEGGWSFFVVERPALAAGNSGAGETVELCLYCDA